MPLYKIGKTLQYCQQCRGPFHRQKRKQNQFLMWDQLGRSKVGLIIYATAAMPLRIWVERIDQPLIVQNYQGSNTSNTCKSISQINYLGQDHILLNLLLTILHHVTLRMKLCCHIARKAWYRVLIGKLCATCTLLIYKWSYCMIGQQYK